MGLSRLQFVAKVLGQLFADEVGRAVKSRRRPPVDVEEHERQRARNVRLALERLGPFYIKVGQILSTRPDFIRPSLITELKKLHDQVSVAPFGDFEPVLAEELSPDWKLLFLDMQTQTPLGAASLAQAYRATLWDGTPAVVKIQRPGIKQIVQQDMALLRRAARLMAKAAPRFNAVIDVDAMLGVVFDAMEPELDFIAEARNMDQGRSSVQKFKHLSVPDVLLAMPRVLIQSLAPGVSIRDAHPAAFTVEERLAIGRDLLAYIYHGFFVDRYFHADPHPGNIFVYPGQKASLIDWGMVGRVDRRTSMLMVLILLTLGQNDGHGLSKAWIEMGRATPWADAGGFANDMSRLVPKILGASLADLNFGVTLTAVLKSATKRGVQTSPVISLLGKAFGNIEGSIRYLAPELSLVEVFEDELQAIMVDLLRELLSKQQAARTAMELILGSTAIIDQLRGLMRDLSTPGSSRFGFDNRSFSRQSDVDAWVLLGLSSVVLSLEQRLRNRTRRTTTYNHR
ncbi:MAG: AarF/ABC1/UbiB kinase family protein [Pseudonocardiales bacterium]|nr:AarF/ABC1/UbiB kinase family protein [Pseudonocardiales bacterium]